MKNANANNLCGFSLVILWEIPENVVFFRVPSDHPLLPPLRTAAKKKASQCSGFSASRWYYTTTSEEDTKVILDAFYGGDLGDMELSP